MRRKGNSKFVVILFRCEISAKTGRQDIFIEAQAISFYYSVIKLLSRRLWLFQHDGSVSRFWFRN